MAVYEPDSSATAVILCKLTDISYKWGIESFRLVSEYKVKIKVLKPEGTSYADVIIPYYELPNNAMKENIIGLDASAYNQSDYQAHESQSVLEKLYGNSLKKFVTSLYHGKKISSEEVQDLSEFLKNLEDREE